MTMRAISTAVLMLVILVVVSMPVMAEATHDESGHTDHTAVSSHETPPHGGSGEEAGVNPMRWQSDLAIWTAVVFAILLLTLWVFAWKPIMQGLDKRESHIADEIAGAERSNAEAKKMLEQYQQKLADTEEEVRLMIEEAKADAKRAGDKLVEQAKLAAEAEKKRALQDIASARDGVLKDLAEQSASLAVSLAGKIVQSELSSTAHEKLIEKAVSDFGKQPS